MDRRRMIGGIAAVLLAGGLLQQWVQPEGYAWQPVAAGCLRVGVLMFALWLAYPDLRRIPAWMWGGLISALAVVAWRPRLAIVVVPVLALLWTLRGLARNNQATSPPRRPSRHPRDTT